jgi:hypothetical protein
MTDYCRRSPERITPTSNDLKGLRAGKYLSETTVLSSIGGMYSRKKLRWKEKNKPGLAGPGYAGGKEG